MPSPWDELLDEFRKLGGTADNVRLGEGEFGRGLFVEDGSRPFLLSTPPNLLVKSSDVMFQNGALRIHPDAEIGERERAFFEAYHAHVSWSGGGRSEIERVFEEAAALPPDLRTKLRSTYHCGNWFADPTPELIQRRFIGSRECEDYRRQGPVMMPFIELANHGSVCTYDIGEGISLRGRTDDEITVRYSKGDSYEFFRAWGFAAQSDVAFSRELSGFVGGRPLVINRQTANTTTPGNRPLPPTLSFSGNAVHMNFAMLGNRQFRKLCRESFCRVFKEMGFGDVSSLFDHLVAANRQRFTGLLTELEPVKAPMAQKLRRMARFQLQALSYC